MKLMHELHQSYHTVTSRGVHTNCDQRHWNCCHYILHCHIQKSSWPTQPPVQSVAREKVTNVKLKTIFHLALKWNAWNFTFTPSLRLHVVIRHSVGYFE